MVELRDLNFSYGNNIIFDKLNLKIKEGSFISISTPQSGGKTTLVKIIASIIKVKDDNRIISKNLNEEDIGFILDNNVIFKETTCYDFIFESLKSKKLSKGELDKKINEVSSLLKTNNILGLDPNSLSDGEKQLLLLTKELVKEPKILLLDEALCMLDDIIKNKMFRVLKNINKKNKMTIIYMTTNLEDSLFGRELVLIDEKVVLNKEIAEAFNDENIFKSLNLELPFMASLSHKLKYYDLTDTIILDMDTLVNKLWK